MISQFLKGGNLYRYVGESAGFRVVKKPVFACRELELLAKKGQQTY
jgi:hypothetical protein